MIYRILYLMRLIFTGLFVDTVFIGDEMDSDGYNCLFIYFRTLFGLSFVWIE